MNFKNKFLKINNQIVYAISDKKGVIINNQDLENELVRRVYTGQKVGEAELEEIAVEIGLALDIMDFTPPEVEQVGNNYSDIDLDDYSSS